MPPAERADISVPRAVPVALGFVAGYVDGCTFVALFGLFVAQVTGSFVVAGAQFAGHGPNEIVNLLAIPVFFAAAVATTIIVASLQGRGHTAFTILLALEAAALAGFLWLGLMAAPFDNPNGPAALGAALLGLSAMGMQSAMVRLLMRSYPSTNVMTTNTTQLAVDATETVLAWFQHRRAPADAARTAIFAQQRRRLFRLLPIVTAFFVGTASGTLAYLAFGFACLVLAIAILLTLAGWTLAQRA
jgi:uncharacterized membrane protein YoaK (UPF0700 family)